MMSTLLFVDSKPKIIYNIFGINRKKWIFIGGRYKMIKRLLDKMIRDLFFQGKIIVVLGPRQSGKTTLMKMIVQETKKKSLWLNADEPDFRQILSGATSTRLKSLIGDHQLVIIDEVQRIPDIGITLKLIADNIAGVQVLVTGSSALDLSGRINEPLTGRKMEFFLFPVSYMEMASHTSPLEEKRLAEHRMIFGYYPEIVLSPGKEKEILMELSESYLYKDIFSMAQIKKPIVLEKLVQALALQVGWEVNYHELGQTIGADKETVERYIDLLEKAFVIFRLSSFSRNMRNEIKKGRKIYFYDNGIRNAIIKNFNPLELRQDSGALWENFLITERLKRNHYLRNWCNKFFWRTTSQQEIDYIEERDGEIFAYEFKRKRTRPVKVPTSFATAYPGARFAIVSADNFEPFVTGVNEQ